MPLYRFESRVWAGISGARPDVPNATVKIEVHSATNWTGILEVDDSNTRLPKTGAFHIGDDYWGFRVAGQDGTTYEIEKPAAGLPTPGKEVIRTTTGSVQVLLHGQIADRGLTELSVYNDDSWEATLRLEGEDLSRLQVGDLINLRADGSDVLAVGRVEGIQFSGDSSGMALGLHVLAAKDSPPPL